MCKVEILPAAWNDLVSINDWYKLNMGLETAEKVTDGILDTIERLESFPESGSMTPDPWLNKMGYRMVISGEHHAAIFRRIENIIYVYTVADTKTEYTKIFRRNFEL